MGGIRVAVLIAALCVAGCQSVSGPKATPEATSAPRESSSTDTPRAPDPGTTVADVASPYTAPAQPPEYPGPLDIRPSRDAHDRLARVLTGNLVDSGDFHRGAFRDDDPVQPGRSISFTTPSGNITCTGSPGGVTCAAASSNAPMPPRPRKAPPGNWGAYVQLNRAGLTYGLAVGNPIIPVRSATLSYGSTLRLGNIECLSAEDGLTCVDFPTSTGFHLSRDDLTPLKAVDPVGADTRVEPRTPGNDYCGVLVNDAALTEAIASLPNSTGREWQPMGPGDFYTCHDVQVFGAGTNDYPPDLPAMPQYVLVFDRGRYVGSVTDRAYVGLTGDVDANDPTVIRLTFSTEHAGEQMARARYQDDRVTLLDPVPAGALPLG